MKMTEKTSPGPVLITGYGDGGFRLGDRRHSGHLLIYRETFFAWDIKGPGAIKKPSLAPVLDVKTPPEFLLLGLGNEIADQVLLSRKFSKRFGLPVEVMSTGAAARTYNILVMEGRFVGAGLIAV